MQRLVCKSFGTFAPVILACALIATMVGMSTATDQARASTILIPEIA
jgi:hypothetical protein